MSDLITFIFQSSFEKDHLRSKYTIFSLTKYDVYKENNKKLPTKWFGKNLVYSDTFGEGGRDLIRSSSLSISCSLFICATSDFLCWYVTLHSGHFLKLPSKLPSLGTSASLQSFGVFWLLLTSEEVFGTRLKSACFSITCATTLLLQGENKNT